MSAGKKICTKCKKIKSCLEFHKDKTHKDGLQSWCKACGRKYQKEIRELLKRETMLSFGGRCVHIDENGVKCSKNVKDNLRELHLIHPNDDGDEHRNLISNGQAGYMFYRELKKRNWNTDGFVIEIRCKTHHHSLDNSGNKNPLYGTFHSKETKAKMRETNTGKNNPMYGKYKKGKFNDPVWLRKKYINCIMSSYEIAKECGVSYQTILSRMKEFNIPRRKRGSRKTI